MWALVYVIHGAKVTRLRLEMRCVSGGLCMSRGTAAQLCSALHGSGLEMGWAAAVADASSVCSRPGPVLGAEVWMRVWNRSTRQGEAQLLSHTHTSGADRRL
jgi:hypothetical protein